MHAARRCLSAFVLTAALATTGSVVAATPKPQDVQVRVYDPAHKDYHNWDEREDHAYRHYMEERHEQYRKYDKLTEGKRAKGLLELAAQPSGLVNFGVIRIRDRYSQAYNVAPLV